MKLEEIMLARRSVRKYLDKDVPDEMLTRAFEIARWAPNGGGFESWKFLVVKNRDLIKRAADAAQAKVDMLTHWPEAGDFNKDILARIRNNATFFRHAPVLIGALSQEYKSVIDQILAKREKDPIAREMIEGRRSAPSRVQEIGGFVVHLLLLFQNMGLGTCWMTGPLVAKGEIEEILGVAPGWDLMALIPVGYPAESPTKTRKPVNEIMTLLK
jgi:nitroreductase